jgi:hypothetical protein
MSNVMVERLTILLRIREVPDSNFGQEISYPDMNIFVVFLSPSKQMLG